MALRIVATSSDMVDVLAGNTMRGSGCAIGFGFNRNGAGAVKETGEVGTKVLAAEVVGVTGCEVVGAVPAEAGMGIRCCLTVVPSSSNQI